MLTLTPRCLFTEVGDGTGVALHLDSGAYFTLNATGVTLWKRLASAPASRDALAELLIAEYDVDEPTARGDVDALVSQLIEKDLILPG
jgi:hypothetical protein